MPIWMLNNSYLDFRTILYQFNSPYDHSLTIKQYFSIYLVIKYVTLVKQELMENLHKVMSEFIRFCLS